MWQKIQKNDIFSAELKNLGVPYVNRSFTCFDLRFTRASLWRVFQQMDFK